MSLIKELSLSLGKKGADFVGRKFNAVDLLKADNMNKGFTDEFLGITAITPYIIADKKIGAVNGAMVGNNDYDILRYSVTPGEKVYLKATKDVIYQWQANFEMPPNAESNANGTVAADGYNGYITVPNGAGYLFISRKSTDTFTGLYTWHFGSTFRKTEQLTYTLERKSFSGDGKTWTDSTLSLSAKFRTIPGHRYRITVNNGFQFMVFLNNKKNNMGDMRMFEFVSDSYETKITVNRENFLDLALNVETGLKFEHVLYRNPTGRYDIVVAASDSIDADKQLADLVCDGVNDEVELDCAMNANISNGSHCRVLILPGKYTIGKFSAVKEWKDQGSGAPTTLIYQAVTTRKSFTVDNRYTAILEGKYMENGIATLDEGAVITIDPAVYTALDANTEYVMFGAIRAGTTNMGLLGDYICTGYEGIKIAVNGRTKKIVALDGVGCFGFFARNNRLYTEPYFNAYHDTDPLTPGLVGIRADRGSDIGSGFGYIKTNTIKGFYEGLAICGEHLIIEGNLQHSCYVGFTLGNYPSSQKMEHPNIFIGNSVEKCVRFAILNRYGATTESDVDSPVQTLIYIGGSGESTWTNSTSQAVVTLPIKEIVRGAYRGRIETDYSDKWATNSLIETDGSCKHMWVVDTAVRSRGANTATPAYAKVQPSFEYWDETNNVIRVATPTGWKILAYQA